MQTIAPRRLLGGARRVLSVAAFNMIVACTTATAATAEPLAVFTTIPDLAALAEEVGGEEVEASSMVVGREDAHFAEAKPSYVKRLSKADVFITMGLELEVGYLDPLLRAARNTEVMAGSAGHIVAAEVIAPLQVPTNVIVTRALGDVHGGGNPHFNTDPLSALSVADLIRERLSALRPAKAEYFQQRFDTFKDRIGRRLVGDRLHEKYDGTKLARLFRAGRLSEFLESQGDAGDLAGWLGMMAPHRGAKAIDDHNMWPYFARTFGIEVVGHLEPVPGIQPTTKHIEQVVQRIRAERIPVLIKSSYYDPRHARFVAENTGVGIAELAHQVGGMPGTEGYLEMVDYNVRALVAAIEGAG